MFAENAALSSLRVVAKARYRRQRRTQRIIHPSRPLRGISLPVACASLCDDLGFDDDCAILQGEGRPDREAVAVIAADVAAIDSSRCQPPPTVMSLQSWLPVTAPICQSLPIVDESQAQFQFIALVVSLQNQQVGIVDAFLRDVGRCQRLTPS
ncbi:MAG: hypothetical protein U5R48_14295 [Gammaproteobacteria bacterium]|nr:hypothetical protein [Gammaproteobacteria bacterium]